jgi:hypothetical protein
MLHEDSRCCRADRATRRRKDTTPIAGPEQEDWPFDYDKGARQQSGTVMIRKLQSGEYRLYSRKINPKTGRRRNLGTFRSRAAAEKHERAVQYFKRH